MKILLKAAEIIDSHSKRGERVNILIDEGIITQISDQIAEADRIVESSNLKVSMGWVDLCSFLGEPGFEHKETLESGSLAAAHGGFTSLACLPNTFPTVQDKNAISFYTQRSKDNVVSLFPLAAVTVNTHGVDLTEMLDLHNAGAIAFTDGFKSINNADIILKTLLYLSKIGANFINKPNETSLSNSGVANEGFNSTILGLKGIPSLAEEIAIIRDLKLLEYAGGRMHFTQISTANSVKLIREAKNRGLNVTCDIAAHQIAFDDSVLKDFDTNYKVNPPFRSTTDIEEMWRGLKDGTIDAISSSHSPQDEESKNLEFDLAEFGVIGLETAFSLINTKNTTLGIHELVEKFTVKPREILGVSIPKIQVGEIANLTAFDPDLTWTYTEKDIHSKSKNSPFKNYAFKGRSLGVFNNRRSFINSLFTEKRR